MTSPEAPDWGAVYGDHAAALATLVKDLDHEQLAVMVPSTPAWAVGDVVRHLAGVGSDVLNGRMDGAPGPGWTARQVTERGDTPVADLLTEIDGNVAPIQAKPAPIVAWDIAVHHADVREALGLEPSPQELWQPVFEGGAQKLLGDKPVTVRSGEATYGAGGPELEVEPYELFRALFSRRSRGQIATWAGESLNPDEIGLFGGRDDDVK